MSKNIKAASPDYQPKFNIQEGDAFPIEKMVLHDGSVLDLKKLKFKWIALFFYPQDLSPTCSKQACNLKDAYTQLKRKGILILGVSPDDASKHQRFIEKHQLPFPLVVDVDAEMATQLGIFSLKKFMGRVYEGIHRSTVVLDSALKVHRIIYPVVSGIHHQQILEACKT